MSDTLNGLNIRNCVGNNCGNTIYRADEPDQCGLCQLKDKMFEVGKSYGWDDYRMPNPAFIEHHKGIRQALETGMLEGVKFTPSNDRIEPGDMYIAERNDGLKILTCREHDEKKAFVVPVELGYCYDTGECIKVILDLM